MRAVVRHAFVVAAAVVIAACGNQMEPAQKAITDIESAVAAAGADAEKYIPEQVAAVKGSVDALKAAFDQKDYKSVVTGAPAVLAEAQGLVAAAAAKKDEVMAALNGEWTQLSTELPAAVTAIQGRIDELSKAKKLPEGLDKAAVASASAGLAEAQALWTEATNAFGAGALEEAVTKANAVKAKANELMSALGMTAAPAA
jgi:hypothetical protein